ncbi:nuclease-related domain-containing protein [Bacillus sp. DJP31]|uniref:nuclease-related domain-containing protein n=1 Tax=Bacillus sp. DJP31 TaxID=3409789 RepID=UPI003BB4ACB2
MAQLIKLLDFVSRYEMNMYRYPTQYIRLKKQHWNKLKKLWEEGLLEVAEGSNEPLIPEKKQRFHTLRNMMKQKGSDLEGEEINEDQAQPFPFEKNSEDDMDDNGLPLDYKFTDVPKDEEELKLRFLNQLIEFQISWASSTIRDKSYVDRELYNDDQLKYYLQRFPDNYLVLYKPVFFIQKAPIELEVIMISPTETWCITLLEGKEDSVFYGTKERFWTEKHMNDEKKILSPLLAANRMEKIVRNIYQNHSIELPIRRVVLNRTGYIDYPYVPVDIELIDKRNYDAWFSSLRRPSSPIKHVQLKAAKVLLQHCQTTYVKRPEWDRV